MASIFNADYYNVSYLETSTKLNKVNEEVFSLRKLKIETGLFSQTKGVKKEGEIVKIMRKRKMNFSPSKYCLLPSSQSPSVAFLLPSLSTLKVDMPSLLPESTQKKKAEKMLTSMMIICKLC